MLPRTQPYQLAGSGDTSAGLFEDIGTRSLQTVRIGQSAGKASSGTGNTYIGVESGKESREGSFSVYAGFQSGMLSTQSSYATIIGAYGGRVNKGSEVTLIGYKTGELNKGDRIVAIGPYAMRENYSGTGSVAVGFRALERSLDGDYNVVIGTESCQDMRSGNFTTAAGHQSCRAAFQNSYGCYFGAFSGYSNSTGDGNCLFGFSSGYHLTSGSYNVGIGPFTLYNARDTSSSIAIGPYAGANMTSADGSVIIGKNSSANSSASKFSVIIGTEAGLSNEGDNNVLLGARVATNSALRSSVVIGVDAAPNISGEGSVIIGASVASTLTNGSSNVLIGRGADGYRERVNSGIAIGTSNTFTSTNSISIGDDIVNERTSSILLGYQLKSDANNSVVMGNDISIQSVIYWKDPLNYSLTDTVKSDAITKLGISNIEYGVSNQMLLSPSGETYLNATVGLITSNTYNSITQPLIGRVSPPTYDLRTAVSPSNYMIIRGASVSLLSDSQLSDAIALNQIVSSLDTSISQQNIQGIDAIRDVTLPANTFLSRHTSNFVVSIPTACNAVINIVDIASSSTTASLVVPKAAAFFHSPVNTSNINYVDVIPSSNYDNAVAVPPTLIQSSQGLTNIPDSTVRFTVITPPSFGKLNNVSYQPSEPMLYTPFTEGAFAKSDRYTIRPVLEIIDDAQNVFGCPSSNDVEIAINFVAPPTLFYAHQLLTVDHKDIILSSNILRTIPDQIAGITPIRIVDLSSNVTLTVGQDTFSSNVLAGMVKEEIYKYSDAAYSSYLSDIRQSAQAITSSNQEVFMNAYGNFYTITVPDLTSALSNTIVSTSNVQYETVINEDDQSQTTIEIVTFTQPNDPIIIGLSNISANAVNVPLGLPSTYATFSNAFTLWVQTYDSNITYPEIGLILSSNLAFETNYLNATPFAYDVAVEGYSNLLSVATTSNELVVATNTLLDFVSSNLPVIADYATYSNVLSNISEIETVVYKYFETPRLFLTYDDLIAARTLLTVDPATMEEASVTIEVGDPSDPVAVVQYPIKVVRQSFLELGPSELPPIELRRDKTVVKDLAIYDNTSILCDTVYVGAYPQHGRLSFTPSSNVLYSHANPWMTSASDSIKLVLQKDSQTKDSIVSLQFVPNDIAYEPFLLIPSLSVSSNVANTYVTIASVREDFVPLSNTTMMTFSNIDAAGNSNTSNETIIEFVAPGFYDPDKGLLYATSNIFTSNIIEEVTYESTTESNIRSNVYLYVYETTYTEYQDGVYIYQSFTPSTSNFVEELGSNVYVSSNITMYQTYTIDHYYTRMSDTHIAQLDSDREHRFHFSKDDPTYYLYTQSSDVRAREEGNIETTSNMVVSSRTSVSVFTSNLILHSNITVLDPLFPLTRHIVYHGNSNSVYTIDETQSLHVDVVQSNVGPIKQFTQKQLDDGDTWLRLRSPSLSNTLVFTLDTQGTVANITIDTVVVATLNTVDLGSEVVSFGTSFESSNLGFWNQVGLTFTPDMIHIQTLEHGALHDGSKYAMAFDFETRDRIHYVATSPFYTSDKLRFYFSSNATVFSPIYVVNLYIEQDPYEIGIDTNIGLSYQTSNTLHANVFTVARGPIDANNTQILVTNTFNASLNKTSFSMSEVHLGHVFVSANDLGSLSSFNYDVLDASTSTILSTDQEFMLRAYNHVSFPTVENVNNSSTSLKLQQLGYDPHVSNILEGPLWSYIFDLNTADRGPVALSNIELHVTAPLSSGFLWDEERQRALPDTFTIQDFVDHRVHYIPYTSNFMPNETLQTRIIYDGRTSAEYNIPLKNYVSRFPALAVDPTIKNPQARQVQLSSSIKRSQGLIDDGFEWYPQSVDIPLQFVAPLQDTSVVSTLSNAGETLYQSTITLHSYTHSVPLTWQSTDPVQDSIDQADRWNLLPVLSRVSCNVLEERDIVFYVNTPPTHGIILDLAGKSNVVSFTDTELIQQRIIYQHIGVNNTSNDIFTLGLSSTPYDLSTDELAIDINIRDMPYITTNKEQFLFHSTIDEATSTPQRFGSNLQTQGSGFVHVLGSNVDIPTIFPTQAVHDNNVEYFISPSYFEQHGSNAPFPKMYMELTANSTNIPGYVNTLALEYDVYRPTFIVPYDINLNRYVSSNIITQNQAARQQLSYDIDRSLAASCNLEGRIVSYFLQVRPENGVFDDTTLNDMQATQTQHLRTYNFEIELVDENDSTLILFEFTHDKINVTTPTTSQSLDIPAVQRFSFGEWHNFLFVNEDPDNGKYASLYLNYDVTQSRIQNADRNILRGQLILVNDLGVIKHIYLRADMQSASNYKGDATTFTQNSQDDGSLGSLFELQNDRNSLQFRNQEVFITTYTLEETETGVVSAIESLNHNVVIGKEITVRGTNNICIGNRFVTSGKNSIIVGNDIGSGDNTVGTINDVYESIVIGNESFQNSIVRDVISIGNRNLNNLFQSPVEKVNDFLSQRPILIGNDITQDRLDFNINIGNAFTKTIIGGEQIYLGLSGETVGIGYNSNEVLSDRHMLHVNGSITASNGIDTPKVYEAKDIIRASLRIDVYPSVSAGDVVVIDTYQQGTFVVQPTSIASNVGVIGILEVISNSLSSNYADCEVCTRGITNTKVKGPFTVGDLITTSDTFGVCQKVDSTIRHNYTFAKVLASSTDSNVVMVPCQLL